MGKASRKKRIEEKKTEALKSTGGNSKGMAIGFAVVGALCVALIGGAVVAVKTSEGERVPGTSAQVFADATLPKGALPADDAQHPFGWVNGTFDPSKPTLAVWEDFQCPGCANFEGLMGPVLKNLANEQVVNVVYRPTTFLDTNLGNDSSRRATRAFGCAIDAGKGIEFHDTVFANQPSEGAGYTDQDITTFAGLAGIEGPALDQFNACVADKTFDKWAQSSTGKFYEDKVPGTPFVTLNGVELDQTVVTDEKLLRDEIARVAAGGAVTGGTETPVSVPSSSPAP